MNKKLEAALDRMAQLTPFGGLQLAADPSGAVTAVCDELEAARKVIAAALELADLQRRPGESYTEAFDRNAEAFYRDTGFIAPGKSPPLGMPQPPHRERQRALDAWAIGFRIRFYNAIAAYDRVVTK